MIIGKPGLLALFVSALAINLSAPLSVHAADTVNHGSANDQNNEARKPKQTYEQLEWVCIKNLRKKKYDEAIVQCTQAISLKPGKTGAWYTRGNIWLKMEDYDKAIADYSEAVRRDPTYSLAWFSRSKAWMAKGEYDKAVSDLDEALRNNTEAVLIHYLGGKMLTKMGRYEKAIAFFSEGVRVDPEDEIYREVRYLRGRLLKTTGKPDEADADFVVAFKNGRRLPLTFLAYARWMEKKGKQKIAAGYYRKAANSKNRDPLERNAIAEAKQWLEKQPD